MYSFNEDHRSIQNYAYSFILFRCDLVKLYHTNILESHFTGTDWGIHTAAPCQQYFPSASEVTLKDKSKLSPWIRLYPINSLAPGKFQWNFRYLIFQIISVIDGWVISCELALRWMSPDLTDDKSTLVQVMAWCRQATSHYLSQCWPRSLSPYGVTRPQWVNYDSRLFWRKMTIS